MNTYEVIFIIKKSISLVLIYRILLHYTTVFNRLANIILKREYLGMRRICYFIKGNNACHYVCFVVKNSHAHSFNKIHYLLKNDSNILRYLIRIL